MAVPGEATPVAIRWLMPRTMKADGTAAVIDAVSGIHLIASHWSMSATSPAGLTSPRLQSVLDSGGGSLNTCLYKGLHVSVAVVSTTPG